MSVSHADGYTMIALVGGIAWRIPSRITAKRIRRAPLAAPGAQAGLHPTVLFDLMGAVSFDEIAMFRAVAESGARAVLIGRQALIALGMPVMTADYDFWIAADDAQKLNDALAVFHLLPSRSPAEARAKGRYVLENDQHIDVLVAASVSTVDGTLVRFEDLWVRRQHVDIGDGVKAAIPCIDDLIATKRFAARPRDADDIRWLEHLRNRA